MGVVAKRKGAVGEKKKSQVERDRVMTLFCWWIGCVSTVSSQGR